MKTLKYSKRILAAVCILILALSISPAVSAESDADDERLYQPNPLCGTCLGKNSDGVYEFEITIPDDYENKPTPLLPGPFSGYVSITNSVPEGGANENVIYTRAQYFYGRYPGTADYNEYVYKSTGAELKAVVHVTVVKKEVYDELVSTSSTPEGVDHRHSWYYKWTTPTCQDEGAYYRTCSYCKERENLVTAETVDHIYRSEITRYATAAYDGIRTYKCINCREKYTETIPRLSGGDSSTTQTETPVQSETPVRSETPAKTETPAESETPAKTETPAESETPTQQETSAQPAPPQETVSNPAIPAGAGSGGAARSERGTPLNRRADGNYEYCWVEGYRIIKPDGTVDRSGRKLKITTFSPTFQELSVRQLPIELEDVETVYFGKKYNFLLFKQPNDEESKTKEVLRAVKYSKDWERLGEASFRDINTTKIETRFGNYSFAEAGDMLYIHLSHTMYTSSDGLRHQSNMTFSIRQTDMAITDGRYNVSYEGTGYVSHSFSQDILVDEAGSIITLDRGDAYPRGAMLFRYKNKAGGDSFTGSGDVALLRSWPGKTGDNETGSSVWALAETSQGYLSAVIDSGKGDAYSYLTDSATAYLLFTPKDDFSASATRTRTVAAGTALVKPTSMYLIPFGPEGGWVTWIVTEINTQSGNSYTAYYAPYAADGTVGAATKLENVPVPYITPIYSDGKVIWCGSRDDPEGLQFCVMDPNGNSSVYRVTGELGKKGGSNAADPVPDGQQAFPFTDVNSASWYRPFVEHAYAAGIVKGTTSNTYSPDKTLTLAESVTLAARIYAENHGETAPSGGSPWYQAAYNYCVSKGVIDRGAFPVSSMVRPATRYEMVRILDGAVSKERMTNEVQVPDGTIPDLRERDLYGPVVYRWYRAGILAGDEDHSFNGGRNIKRSEVAKILCKINNLD